MKVGEGVAWVVRVGEGVAWGVRVSEGVVKEWRYV